MNRVYKNLHNGMWSIQSKGSEGYRVSGHKETVELTDVTFIVYESGRQRVLVTKQKQVHAFVQGTVCESAKTKKSNGIQHSLFEKWVRISYNPYKGAWFYRCDTGEKVETATRVIMTKTSVYALVG